MSLLKHYSDARNEAIRLAPKTIESNTIPEDATLQSESQLVDITVEELGSIVNLPPEADPFVVYLYTYIQQLVFILNKISEIKSAEKSLKLRLKQAEKLLNSLLKVETQTVVDSPETDSVVTSSVSVVQSDDEPVVLKSVHNLDDFR